MNNEIIYLIIGFLAGAGAGMGIVIVIFNTARIKIMREKLKRMESDAEIANMKTAFDKFRKNEAAKKDR